MSAPTSDASPSSFPATMGPGARRVPPGQHEPSLLQEVAEFRSHYSVTADDSNLNVGYDLRGAQRNYSIPFDAIPLHGMAKWIVWGGRRRASVSGAYLLDTLRGAENMSGRRVTQKEAEGFAFHSSKKALYAYSGAIASFVGGYWLAWNGRHKMKFPFMSPRPAEKYEKFPNKYLPVVSGAQARLCWQMTRANIYVALALIFVQPLFSSMGDTIMTVGLYRDDRTKDIVKSIKGSFDRLQANRAKSSRLGIPMPDTQQQSTSSDPEGFSDADSQTYQREMDAGMSNDHQNQQYSGDNAYTDGNTDTGMLSDSAVRQRESKQSSPSNYSTSRNPTRRSPADQTQPPPYGGSTSSSPSDLIWDDASPTAGNDPEHNSSASYQQSQRQGGSAWARIRQGITSSQPQPQPQSRGSSSSIPARLPTRSPSSPNAETKGDSFSFSTTDEEKQLAKEHAQREFDDMLERERRESGSGDYVRDMYATEAGRAGGQQQGGFGGGRSTEGGGGGGGESIWERRRRMVGATAERDN